MTRVPPVAPDVARLDPGVVPRVLMTVSCADADGIPKVDDAGTTKSIDGATVQVMHNGLLIEEGCYYGPWMTEIIRSLRGHHEPQEERVFAEILRRLHGDETSPAAMIELGSFWAYYSMWFAREFPGARVIDMEPDPAYLAVGKRNWALNSDLEADVSFVHGAIGTNPGELVDFVAESDGQSYAVAQFDLRALMESQGLSHVDVLLCDTQGWETVLLNRAREDFAQGRVRFIVVSTHHHTISGSPVTHQDALAVLREAGAHVIAEHSVFESFSGDGLIAASFDERDRGWTVPVSHARASESLYGEPEHDLARVTLERDAASQRAAAAEAAAQAEHAEAERLRAELQRIVRTKTWRLASVPRQIYARLIRR